MSTAERNAPAARATGQTLAANILIAAINVATGVLAARVLGPGGRGALAAIQLLPSVLAVLAMLGMHEALAFFSARDPRGANVHLPSAVTVALLSSVVFVAAGYMLLPLFLRHFSPDVVQHARRYLLLIPLYAVVMLPSHVLRGTGEFGWWNALRIAPAFIWLVVIVLEAAGGTATAGNLADGNLLATAALGLVVAVVIGRQVSGPYRVEVNRARALMSYGLPAAGAVLPQVLNLRLDQLIMAAVLSPRSLGLYVVAVAWSSAVNPVLFAIGMVVLPRVAGSQDPATRNRILIRAVRIGGWAAIGTSAMVLSVTPIAFRFIFPPNFRDAVPAAMVLVIAGGLFGFNFILAEATRGLGRPAITLYAEVAGLAATGLSLASLLHPLGILGASISSVLGYGMVTGVLLRDLRRQVPGLQGNTLTLSAASESVSAVAQLIRQRSLG